MLDTLIGVAGASRRGVARLGTLMGYAAGWGFIAIAALITFDVLARRFLGFSTQATTELSGYALAFGIAWGLAHALSMRAHVRIDVVVNLFPDRIRYWLHLASLAFLAVLAGYLFYGAWTLVEESLLFGATDISVIRTPLAIPQGLWAFGLGVVFVLILAMLVECFLLIIAGRGAEAESLLHSRTYQEEVAEALEAVGEPVPPTTTSPEVKP
ncbi:TRAP transporter small permease subunit [Phreatobacter sp.]|uniref:TRAP transporter small permease subunit n=1 Tax=Phreatobacter sp. TaxID=1966341 RepID=UPI003F707127